MIMTDKKTYEDFGIILEKLKNESGSAYERMGIEINMNPSTLQRMAKTRAVKLPDYDVMEKVAKYFHLDPEFFYEYRLRKVLDYIDENRKFLNVVERAKRNYRPMKKEVLEIKEEAEEELEEELEVGEKKSQSENTG